MLEFVNFYLIPGLILGSIYALFAVGNLNAPVTRAQLLAAERLSQSSTDWKIVAGHGDANCRARRWKCMWARCSGV